MISIEDARDDVRYLNNMGRTRWKNIWLINHLNDGPDKVTNFREAESRALKVRKDQEPYVKINHCAGISTALLKLVYLENNSHVNDKTHDLLASVSWR